MSAPVVSVQAQPVSVVPADDLFRRQIHKIKTQLPSVHDMRTELAKHRLPTDGNKSDLLHRLLHSDFVKDCPAMPQYTATAPVPGVPAADAPRRTASGPASMKITDLRASLLQIGLPTGVIQAAPPAPCGALASCQYALCAVCCLL